MSQHYINYCSCGKVISQCRCAGNKTKNVISGGCQDCKTKSNIKDSTRISGDELKKRLGRNG